MQLHNKCTSYWLRKCTLVCRRDDQNAPCFLSCFDISSHAHYVFTVHFLFHFSSLPCHSLHITQFWSGHGQDVCVCVWEASHSRFCCISVHNLFPQCDCLFDLNNSWYSHTQERLQRMNLVTKLWKLRNDRLISSACVRCTQGPFVSPVTIVEVGLQNEWPRLVLRLLSRAV